MLGRYVSYDQTNTNESEQNPKANTGARVVVMALDFPCSL